jgi:predicted O-methyltransferase YrrM
MFKRVCFLLVAFSAYAWPPSHYLSHKIPPENHRYKTFLLALSLLEERKAQVLVETGTSREGDVFCRGDGCSTLIFGAWARDHRAELYSVDISARNLENAKTAVLNHVRRTHNIHFICSDSVSFLSSFHKPIDFLYLDSFDYDENDPLPSQIHHLNEIKAALPFLTETSIVMIDDCDFPNGGKGKLAIEWLLEQGWKILAQEYQVILGRVVN